MAIGSAWIASRRRDEGRVASDLEEMTFENTSGATAPLRHPSSHSSPRLPPNSARRRAPSAKSATTPPSITPAPPEVISSLISSLSAISEPVEEHFDNLPNINDSPARQEATLAAQASRQSIRPSTGEPSQSSLQQQPQQHGWGMDYGAYKKKEDIVDEYHSDEDAAPPPPARMAKAPTPAKSKTSSKRSSRSLVAYRTSQNSLTVRNSQQNLRGSSDTASIGMPSIERLHNNSSTSLASSADTAQGRGQRRKKSREVLTERVNGVNSGEDPKRSRTGLLSGAAKFLKPIRSKQSLQDGSAKSTSLDTSPRPELLSAGTSQSSHVSGANSVSPRSSHSATSQGALSGHLIPSRRSSLRYSVSESMHEDDQKRYSMNLEHMAIDKSLIEEDHSTVKRIRELQEAREKRQKEWWKESKRSERTKQNSLSGSTMLKRKSSRQSSHMSIAEEATLAAEPVEDKISTIKTPQISSSAPRPSSRASNTSAVLSTPLRYSSKRPGSANHPPASEAHSGSSTSPLKNRKVAANETKVPSNVPNQHNDRMETIDDEVETFLNDPRLTQKIRHPRTGRIIAFSEAGDPEGFAVICCVGMGLTRYLTAFYDELARTLKLRLVTPDRPGIGESEPGFDGTGMPLNWPDDVELICEHLGIVKFSVLAHSAGALYALATALRMPQMIRGRIHLLAPWITPSQMAAPGLSKEPSPTANIPFSQKILSILPASFLKAANASFFGAASASIAKSPKPSAQRRSLVLARAKSSASDGQRPPTSLSTEPKREAVSCYQATNDALVSRGVIPPSPTKEAAPVALSRPLTRGKTMTAQEHRAAYDAALTPRIWDLATKNANPAVDLIICLEKHAPIGFLYTDIARAVVIHHGSRDTRVPVDNVRWLANRMKRCELRVLEGEGHGLMASANVMAEILGEVSGEWEEWTRVVKGKKGRRRAVRAGEYQLELGDEDDDE